VTASLFYLYLAGFILSRGLRDGLNRVFSLLCALFGLWAASFAVMHAFHAPEMAYAAYTISALAWCLYSGMAAHVLLYIAGSGLTRNPWFVTALYAPGILLLAMQWTGHFLGFALYRHPLGWIEIPLTDSPWPSSSLSAGDCEARCGANESSRPFSRSAYPSPFYFVLYPTSCFRLSACTPCHHSRR